MTPATTNAPVINPTVFQNPPTPAASLTDENQRARHDRHHTHDRVETREVEVDESLQAVHDQPRAEQQHPDVLGELHEGLSGVGTGTTINATTGLSLRDRPARPNARAR